MTLSPAPDTAWLYLRADRDDGPRRLKAIERRLPSAWRPACSTPKGRLFLPVGSRLTAIPLGRAGLLVGRWCGPGLDAILTPEGTPDPERAVTLGWGRYCMIWEDDAGVALLRDPSGGLDALTWAIDDLDVMASDLHDGLDFLAPRDLEIDADGLARWLAFTADVQRRVALKGVDTVAPGGVMRRRGRMVEHRQIWSPADIALRQNAPRADDLRLRLDGVMAALLSPHARWIGEISGGFDSATVAASAAWVGAAGARRWLNFRADDAESDESGYALAVARRAGLTLEVRDKPVRALTIEDFQPLARGARPALQGLDMDYDRGVAETLLVEGATGLLTGQGGDAVYFQSADPRLIVDRVRRLGLRGLNPGFIDPLARWTRRPAWSLIDLGLRERFGWPPRREVRDLDEPEDPDPGDHPWLSGAEALPPAKRGQLLQLLNCQIFHGDCARARAAELLHPLLTQPLMEWGLSMAADRLIEGGADRAFARVAFADRIPHEVLGRRGKGELSTFYGQTVLRSLPFFRERLLDGKLVAGGWLDRSETEALLDPDALVWSGRYNHVLLRTLYEVWLETWTGRIAAIRREPEIQPVDHPTM